MEEGSKEGQQERTKENFHASAYVTERKDAKLIKNK